MGRLEFPRSSFLAPPAFSFVCPDGWEAGEAPGALVSLRPVDADDQVSARVEWVRVAAAATLRDIADASFARVARAHPDVEVAVQKLVRFGTRTVFVRGLSTLEGSPARRVARFHGVMFAGAASDVGAARPVRDVLMVTGVCPERDAPSHVPIFVSLASSIEPIDDAPPISLPTPAAADRRPADPFTSLEN